MARGDEEFVEFAKANWVRLQRAAYLLTGNQHQAEEAAQAALVKVYGAWRRVHGKDPYAYARIVLVHLVTDRWRRPMREYTTAVLPEREAPGDVADDVARRRMLIDALRVLSHQERSVVVLRHYLDVSEASVAHELNLPLGTVKSLNSRGLAKLRATVDLLTPTCPAGTEPGG
jgi:RNA polymerase sigma-70 factor (sigma-E family)